MLSALPIVSAGNLCCCLWLIAGGVVAAYYLQQQSPVPITVGDGATVGMMAGAFGAAIYAVLSVPLNLLLAPMQRRMMERVLDGAGDLPAELRQAIESMSTGVGGVLVSFFIMLGLGLVFATIGGVLGAVLFRRSEPPAAQAGPVPTPSFPPAPPPPPPPPDLFPPAR